LRDHDGADGPPASEHPHTTVHARTMAQRPSP
jgi:hypothetical protein